MASHISIFACITKETAKRATIKLKEEDRRWKKRISRIMKNLKKS